MKPTDFENTSAKHLFVSLSHKQSDTSKNKTLNNKTRVLIFKKQRLDTKLKRHVLN